ncbi:MAG: HAMP domain-containing protein [Hespellia sp.]|nr:HAMP domain-containing protein [Hespellia sp.]
MRRSLKGQMSFVFVGLITFILIAILVVNGRFLERYYVVNKTEELISMYKAATGKIEKGEIREEVAVSELNGISEQCNISAIIADNGGGILYMTAREKNGLLFAQLMGYLLGENQKSGRLLKSTEDYEIFRTTDPINETEYIEMWGYIDGEDLFIMRSPMASIRESAILANKFLIYMGCMAVVVSIILVRYFSKRITDPILELAELSKKMANLDFDARYVSGGDNEIGVLGESFNTMSATLKKTIAELKRANNQLQQDIEQKEKIETMRTDFLGNVSHELKTPIALIQGYAEGLKEGVSDDPESREFYCDVIMDEASKMNQMVRNLLTLNQLEFGEDSTQFERFDLVGVIEGVLQSCEILIQQAGATAVFVHNEPVYVWADEFKTEQVVRNYLTNAIHHVDFEKRIEIRMQQKEDTVRVTVFNSGRAIPSEDLDRLWDKFYKVDKAHTREYGGNGIGLSIVKAIMESFHQAYGVTNFDNGVAFWFELDTSAVSQEQRVENC